MVRFTRNNILALLFERNAKGDETSWSDFEEAFGPWARGSRSTQCSKGTFLKYKSQLEIEGKLRKKLSDKTRRPIYYIPEEFEQEAEFAAAFVRLTQGAYVHDAFREMTERIVEQLKSAWLNDLELWLIKKGHQDLTNQIDRERIFRKVKIKII